MAYYKTPKNPVRKVLKALTGVRPPDFVRGYDFKGLTDEQHEQLQDWAGTSVRPKWLTGIGLLEAAEKMVEEAVNNGNIEPDPKHKVLLSATG